MIRFFPLPPLLLIRSRYIVIYQFCFLQCSKNKFSIVLFIRRFKLTTCFYIVFKNFGQHFSFSVRPLYYTIKMQVFFCFDILQKTCFECPAGSSCPSPEQTPESCPVGTYSLGGAGSSGCLQCEAGRSCLDPGQNPVNCDNGQYSLAVSLLRKSLCD